MKSQMTTSVLRRPSLTSWMRREEKDTSSPDGASETMVSGRIDDHGTPYPATTLDSSPMVGAILLCSMRERVGRGTPVMSLASLSEMPRVSRNARSFSPSLILTSTMSCVSLR